MCCDRFTTGLDSKKISTHSSLNNCLDVIDNEVVTADDLEVCCPAIAHFLIDAAIVLIKKYNAIRMVLQFVHLFAQSTR